MESLQGILSLPRHMGEGYTMSPVEVIEQRGMYLFAEMDYHFHCYNPETMEKPYDADGTLGIILIDLGQQDFIPDFDDYYNKGMDRGEGVYVRVQENIYMLVHSLIHHENIVEFSGSLEWADSTDDWGIETQIYDSLFEFYQEIKGIEDYQLEKEIKELQASVPRLEMLLKIKGES